MPSARDVTPQRWRPHPGEERLRILFDDGEYSLISGLFDGDPSIGERWNGTGNGLGFPSQGANPIWHVVPPFLRRPMLHGLLDELSRLNGAEEEGYRQAILQELTDWNRVRHA